MRTNRRMRRDVSYKIRNFFDEAAHAIKEPDYFELLKNHIAEFEIDPRIDSHFYELTWEKCHIHIDDVGTASFDLPENAYGVLIEENDHSSWSVSARIKQEDCAEEVLKYFRQIKELSEASEAFRKGAHEALTELTVERALKRLPQLEKFL